MFSFSVSVHLDSLFTDKRSRCKLYVSSEDLETAGDFMLKIRKIFNINDPIDLFVKDFESLYYIPPGEDVRILQSNNIIVVRGNCNDEVNNEETFYRNKIKKRKRTLSLDHKKIDEPKDDTFPIKEKGKKKDKAVKEKNLNNTSQITTTNFKENFSNKEEHNETVHNTDNSKDSANLHQSDDNAENYMEIDQQNASQKQILPCSITNNSKYHDYRKVYNPSYSTTTFETLGTMATSRKPMFTERRPVHTLKISTTPKLIQPIKVIDNNTPQFTEKIDDTINISDSFSLNNSLEVTENDLNKTNNKSSLELSQKLAKHSEVHENEINVAQIENSLVSPNIMLNLNNSCINCTDIKEETEKCDLDYFTANFVTKRKRKRHRKKKIHINKQVEDYYKSSQLNETTPRTSVKSSAPLIHIKFADDHQTNQADEEIDNGFEKENQLELSTLKIDTPNKNEIEQNITLNNTCLIEKPKSGIKILNDIKICDSFITNSNSVGKTLSNELANKNNIECLPALLNYDLNDSINHTPGICSNSKFKTKTVTTDKSRISTAMQKAINNYFKDLNGTSKKAIQHSNSSVESSSESDYSCDDVKSNFAENCLKAEKSSNLEENHTVLDKQQLNGNNKSSIENDVNLLNRRHLKECTTTTTKEVFSPFSVSESDILQKSLMNSKPMKNNIIAFKTVILTENYTPEISKFIIAKVLDPQSSDNTIRLYILNGGDQLNLPKGKFSLEEDTEEMSTKEISCKWEDIIEPRLLYS